MQTVQIIFIGLCLLSNITVGNQDAKRVILPQLRSGSDPGIGRHTAFVAFPASALGANQGWGVPNRFQNKFTKNVPWDWFPLDGDDVYLSLAPDPFEVDRSYSGIYKLREHCPNFVALSYDYAFGTSRAEKAAQVDLTRGKLFMQPMFLGMRASRLQAHANGPVKVTARSWLTGETRSVTVNIKDQGEIWIGNMTKEFFSPDPNPDKLVATDTNDFLAYYRMASTKTGCTWQPGPPQSSPPHVMNFGVGCSNSNFP